MWLRRQAARSRFVGDTTGDLAGPDGLWPETIRYGDVAAFLDDLQEGHHVAEATAIVWSEWWAARRAARRRSQ